MTECVYLIRSRSEAQFVGKRLHRSFLPQVLQRMYFFVLNDQRVYVAVCLSDFAAPELVLWVRRILGECGDRCDPETTLQDLTGEQQRFSEVYLDEGNAFLGM